MLFVIARPARARRRRARSSPRTGARPLVLLAGALLHAAGVAALFASPPPARPRRVARLRPAREGDAPHDDRALRRRGDLRAGLPRPARRPRQPGVRGRAPVPARGDDHRRALAPPRAVLGGHRGDDARERAAHLLQPQRPLARGGLEVPPHLLARHRARAARDVLPRAVRRRARRPSLAPPRGSHPGRADAVAAVGARRVRLPRSSATARRWGSPRSTPGSPTRTARRPGSSARSSPAGSRTSRSCRSSGCSR